MSRRKHSQPAERRPRATLAEVRNLRERLVAANKECDDLRRLLLNTRAKGTQRAVRVAYCFTVLGMILGGTILMIIQYLETVS